ncbi:AAA-ATPase At3g28510 isoform X2 [Medicago truncatula]|uniref:AAA-ATPase At3g28510 isoform X2 n=1 Tax=Medicago truncatula TaxID=3880 RepID=UPI001968441A|nr:AAA-ATPase At3g28510 isoform X2 [Medicago truncatula]
MGFGQLVLIACLLVETNMTPADVAENLMPKVDNEDVATPLLRLIQALRSIEEEAEKEEGTSAKQESDGEDSSAEKKEDAEMVTSSMLRLESY